MTTTAPLEVGPAGPHGRRDGLAFRCGAVGERLADESMVILTGGILTVMMAQPARIPGGPPSDHAPASLAPLGHPVHEQPLPPAPPTPFTFRDPANIGAAPADNFDLDRPLPPLPAWLPQIPNPPTSPT